MKEVKNEAEFEADVLKVEQLTMVDFWASWCEPCKTLAPIVEEVAKEYEGRMNIVKVSIDDASDLATKYHVLSVPTLIFFKAGEVVDQIVGIVPKEVITQKLDLLL